MKKIWMITAVLATLTAVAQAETIVQWGAPGGESDIVSPQQSFAVSDTYSVSNAVNPSVGASYYTNNTDRAPTFNAAYGNAVGNRTGMIRDFNPDVIAVGMNTRTTVPASLATNEVMVVWESSNFLSVSGSYTLERVTFEAKLYSDGTGEDDLSVYRFILEDAAGDFHISQEFDQADDNSSYTTNSALAAALTWSAYTPFSGGIDVIGASSSPSLTDFRAIGLHTAVADANHNWAQFQTAFFEVDVTVAPITWDGGAGNDNWAVAQNWDGDAVPSNGNNVIITTTGYADVSLLGVDFTVENGKSLTYSGSGTELILEGPDCSLTLATGGTINLGLMRPRFLSGAQLTIEPGASLNTESYGLGFIEGNVKFIANADGVTTWVNSGGFDPRGDNLVVDLSLYDTANGDTLVLVDYGSLGDGNEFASVSVTGGLFGTLDYAYDLGDGNLAIALTQISAEPVLVTSNGTPFAWLDHYGLVTAGDYEAADLLDSDTDDKLNWQEYDDGTDPTGVVMPDVTFTLTEGTGGDPDTLTFAPPSTPWVVEASSDGVEWGMLPPGVTFTVSTNGTVTASVDQPAALSGGGSYRIVEKRNNSKLVVFLTEGQSNMVGWGAKSEGYYHMDDYPCPNMFQLSRGLARLEYDPGAANSIVQAFQPLQTTADRSNAATSHFVSLDFYFARKYAKDHPDEDVLIVKNARGGTGFVNNWWNEDDSLDVLADPYLSAALGQVSNEYVTIEFGGILWHQGEADAANADSAAAYAANLTALFGRHRSVVSNHFALVQAPIVLGTMVPGAVEDNSTGYYDDIDSVHRNIGTLLTNATYADLSSITGRAGLHFVSDGYQTAGELYYDAWLALTTTSHGTPQSWLDRYGLVTGGDYDAADVLDFDNDGLLNWQERRCGTNPISGESVLEMHRVSPGAPGHSVVTWQGVEGMVYNLLSAESLSPVTWSTNVANVIGIAPETVTEATASTFFKIELAE